MTRIIKISQFIDSPSATSREDGILVYEEVMKQIEAGFDVVLDFEGITSLISRFLHPSVGKLYRELGISYDKQVKVTNLSRPTWGVLYKDALKLASNPVQAQARANALSVALAQ
jgi:hypothetical protein